MDEKILLDISPIGSLQSLTAAELRLNEVPPTIDPLPRRKVKAWVRFGNGSVRADAIAARWTPDAVGIVFHVENVEHRCWMWAGAVDDVGPSDADPDLVNLDLPTRRKAPASEGFRLRPPRTARSPSRSG